MAGMVSKLVVVLVILAVHGACDTSGLDPNFYVNKCPTALEIVRSAVKKAVAEEARMAASLLRLHFHDCFVQGCDGSVLLDDNATFTGEKTAVPNNNSLRGFDVVDNIKTELENACPQTVSCADILAIAARDSVVLSGGAWWSVALGRRDSRSASLSGANQNLPAPNSTLQTLITKFKLQGLNQVDLVVLSGGHTIGMSRCVSFRQRLYGLNGDANPQNIDNNYLTNLKSGCPSSGGDSNLSPLDDVTPTKFDNDYLKNVQSLKGLLISDQILYTKGQSTKNIVDYYAGDELLFMKQFAESMVKMGNIKPRTGSHGEIRKNCRRMN
ncbi:hypothetical protein SUGI_0788750 [Cryptomeria japonica]|uniref:peroxidase 49-like n=1 Tax=Cryptomeria japonica TaxID=3369 RepID=UPI002414805D|nr:peroxidase 49-like [Cryptomeria japonica]GLJ38695.1 hypothetical protein SUGI_0788750 [Cryptomeria japonica]